MPALIMDLLHIYSVDKCKLSDKWKNTNEDSFLKNLKNGSIRFISLEIDKII